MRNPSHSGGDFGKLSILQGIRGHKGNLPVSNKLKFYWEGEEKKKNIRGGVGKRQGEREKLIENKRKGFMLSKSRGYSDSGGREK